MSKYLNYLVIDNSLSATTQQNKIILFLPEPVVVLEGRPRSHPDLRPHPCLCHPLQET